MDIYSLDYVGNIMAYIDAIEQELKRNEEYLRKTNHFYSLYQMDVYYRLKHYLILLRKEVATMNAVHSLTP